MPKWYFAHSLPNSPENEWQSLEAHLHQVANMAQAFAEKFHAGDWAYLAGLWHDLGKYSKEFQQMLSDANRQASPPRRRRVDHSTAGARHANQRFPGAGKLLAYLNAGHHGGLPDGKNSSNSDLANRLDPRRKIPAIQDVCSTILTANRKLAFSFHQESGRIGFQVAFFIRMLFSCLVDADFLDTERFLSPENGLLRKGRPKLEKLEMHLSRKLQAFKPDSEINRKRAAILQSCIDKASLEPGLFTLTVPTGGGKTLSSLAFALRHALEFKKDRIIYVIPFTSIIEQNAAVFRNILGEDAVLEHHSNYTPDHIEEDDESDDAIKAMKHRLACENWDAPLIVTTNVQFFNSLFANRPSKCRKLHNVANSIIILDEAQMLPEPYLRPCLEAIRELAANYDCTLILCTATQPALAKTDAFPSGLPSESLREIMPDPQTLHTGFKRIRLTLEDRISNEILLGRLEAHDRVLCIVNTRQRAAELYRLIKDLSGSFHLSARMCPAHRSRVLAQIREHLEEGKECRVISTQLIEAGVDIDFPVVYREMAGLDAIAQAAGRCNRNAKLAVGEVFVFLPEDGKIPRIFRRAAGAAESVLRRYPDDPFSPEAITDYFRQVYWIAGDELDRKQILAHLEIGVRNADFPFKQIADQFRLIESEMLPVIIPWDQQAEELINTLAYTEYPGATLRRLQTYTVQIYLQEMACLQQNGAIRLIQERYPALVSLTPFYRPDSGLDIEAVDLPPEVFFI